MMNEAKDGSGDGASTNVKKIITHIGTAMPNPRKKDDIKSLPTCTLKIGQCATSKSNQRAC